MAVGICDMCAFKQSDCKGNKDLEKLVCSYYKKKPVMNIKQMAERVAELEAEVERLRNVQNMHSGDLISRAEAVHGDGKMIPIELKKRYPNSRDEDITDAFMRGYQAHAEAVQGEWIGKDDDKINC